MKKILVVVLVITTLLMLLSIKHNINSRINLDKILLWEYNVIV